MSEARIIEHVNEATGEIITNEMVYTSPTFDRSDSFGQLAGALCHAQAAMKPALKTSSNPFFKSKYAELASVWEVAQGPLAANGIAVLQPIATTPDGKAVMVTTLLVHSSGEWIASTATWPARAEKNEPAGPQALGSAATYGRRYGLVSLLNIVTEDDDGERAEGRTEKDAKAALPAIPMKPKPAPPPPRAKRPPAKPAPEPPPPTEPPANVAKFPDKPAQAPTPLPPPEPAPAEPPPNQRVELLAQVKAVMEARLVGEKSTEAKRNLMKQAFGKEKWSEICVLTIPQLITGLTLLRGEVN